MRRAAVPRSQLHARARPPSAVPTGWTSTPPVSLAATRAPGARAQAHGARSSVVRGRRLATALPLQNTTWIGLRRTRMGPARDQEGMYWLGVLVGSVTSKYQ